MAGILGAVLVGAIAGIIAKTLFGERYSLILTIIIGCIGGFIGGVIFGERSGFLAQVLVGAIGSVIFLAFLSFFKRK